MSLPGLAARLAEGGPLFMSWSTLPGALGAEAMARESWDACTVDMQHGLIGYAEARAMAMAIMGVGKPAVVRVPLASPDLIGKVLDMGVEAVIAPMVNSASEALEFVQAAKYPPLGGRSWGAHRAMAAFAMTREQYLAAANQTSLAFAMIETRAALEALEAIASTPGLDGLFVGPSDLTVSLTDGASMDYTACGEARDAIARIAGAAQAHGIHAAIYAVTPDDAKRHLAVGYRLIAVGSDLAFMRAGSTAALEKLSI